MTDTQSSHCASAPTPKGIDLDWCIVHCDVEDCPTFRAKAVRFIPAFNRSMPNFGSGSWASHTIEMADYSDIANMRDAYV